ncbi:MAG: response regulator transcription factor [Bacteroidetes bacterium]|nr:response regulator transcription factor [Bacteroidota bacterium]
MRIDKPAILLVEDEESLREALTLNLEIEGYEVTAVGDGVEALEAVSKAHYDLIIMDVMMPELDGISTTEMLRVRQDDTPVLMLSAKSSAADRIAGLKKGADDYVTKPFHLEELMLRIRKLIDKHPKTEELKKTGSIVQFGGNTIDLQQGIATNFKEEKIELSKKELMLLRLFVENKNTIISREKILQTVWGYQVYPTTRTIDNFILNFRKYFEADSRHPVYFHSVRGMGYRFTDERG